LNSLSMCVCVCDSEYGRGKLKSGRDMHEILKVKKLSNRVW
jgi:hypothetical protein